MGAHVNMCLHRSLMILVIFHPNLCETSYPSPELCCSERLLILARFTVRAVREGVAAFIKKLS